MLKNTKRNEGFTIIEVMIVLAIAGLIMLIVFLAVPALQRNSRNTQYKNDAASLTAAATEWSNNNSGKVPTTTDASAIQSLAKTQNITTLTIKTKNFAAQSPAFDTAILVTGAKCGTGTGGTSFPTVAASTRSLAMVYAVEDSSGAVVAQCTES